MRRVGPAAECNFQSGSTPLCSAVFRVALHHNLEQLSEWQYTIVWCNFQSGSTQSCRAAFAIVECSTEWQSTIVQCNFQHGSAPSCSATFRMTFKNFYFL